MKNQQPPSRPAAIRPDAATARGTNAVAPDTPLRRGAPRGPRRKDTLAPPPTTRKQPTQKRAEFTVAAIVDAARELLLKHGADAVTTRQVAARAGVAVGTLYQYFPDRDAILMHLASQIMDEEVDRTTRQLAGLYRRPLNELMGALYERSIEVERRMQGLGRDFHRRHARHLNFGLSLKDKISTQPQNTDTLIATALRMFSDHRHEFGETDRDLATFMLVRGMRNIMTTLVEERPDLLTSPSLAPMLTRLAMAIFAGEPPDADDPEVGQGHFLRGVLGSRPG